MWRGGKGRGEERRGPGGKGLGLGGFERRGRVRRNGHLSAIHTHTASISSPAFRTRRPKCEKEHQAAVRMEVERTPPRWTLTSAQMRAGQEGRGPIRRRKRRCRKSTRQPCWALLSMQPTGRTWEKFRPCTMPREWAWLQPRTVMIVFCQYYVLCELFMFCALYLSWRFCC